MPAEKNYILSALIFFTAAGVPFVCALFVYRRLTQLRERCEEAWRYLAEELNRRHELCARLLVVGRATNGLSSEALGALDHGRAEVLAHAASMAAKTAAENELAVAIGAVCRSISQSGEELSPEALELLDEFAANEERINAAQRFYNVSVRSLNDRLVRFPYAIVATWFGLAEEEGLVIEPTGVERPKRGGIWREAAARGATPAPSAVHEG